MQRADCKFTRGFSTVKRVSASNPCIVQGSTVIFLRMQKNLPANWNTDKDVSGNSEIKKFIAEIRNFIGGF